MLDKLVNKVKAQVRELFNSNCSECGVGFNCDVEAGKDSCWCMYESTNRNVYDVDKKCLCRSCLRKAK